MTILIGQYRTCANSEGKPQATERQITHKQIMNRMKNNPFVHGLAGKGLYLENVYTFGTV